MNLDDDWGLDLPSDFFEPDDSSEGELIYERTCTCGKTFHVSQRTQELIPAGDPLGICDECLRFCFLGPPGNVVFEEVCRGLGLK